MIFPVIMVIFHSYVKLPEGNLKGDSPNHLSLLITTKRATKRLPQLRCEVLQGPVHVQDPGPARENHGENGN